MPKRLFKFVALNSKGSHQISTQDGRKKIKWKKKKNLLLVGVVFVGLYSEARHVGLFLFRDMTFALFFFFFLSICIASLI